jgi:hypothetical protein
MVVIAVVTTALSPSFPWSSALLLFLTSSSSPVSATWNKFDIAKLTKINSLHNNGPVMRQNYSGFGSAIASIGDLDQDGVADLAVGAKGESIDPNDPYGNLHQGALYILFMLSTGKVKSYVRISHLSNGGPSLTKDDQFGAAVCAIGDVNGDNITDLAVGAPGHILGGVYVLFMRRDGTAMSNRLIRGAFQSVSVIHNETFASLLNGPPISYSDRFGQAVAAIGDFNHDGTPDIAVGAPDASTGVEKLWLVFLDPKAKAVNYTLIGMMGTKGGGPTIPAYAGFGVSIQPLRDKDGDGVIELAVGANLWRDTSESKPSSGAVFILFLNAQGTVKYYKYFGQLSQEYTPGLGLTMPLQEFDTCGSSLASVGDINMDNMRQWFPLELAENNPKKKKPRTSVEDLIMGCPMTVQDPGKMYLMFEYPCAGCPLNGYPRTYTEMPGFGNSPSMLGSLLRPRDQYGAAMAGYVDLDGNGIRDVGTYVACRRV